MGDQWQQEWQQDVKIAWIATSEEGFEYVEMAQKTISLVLVKELSSFDQRRSIKGAA